jgi:hypothetical protein
MFAGLAKVARFAPFAQLALLTLSSPARAQPATGLAYEAPAGCPTRLEFFAAVSARGGEFDRADGSGGGDRVVVVSVRKGDHGFGGTVHVRSGQHATDKREVNGPSCNEVVDALAVVTAIELHATTQDLAPVVAASAADKPASTPPYPSAVPRPGSPEPTAAAPPSPDKRLRGSTRIFPPRRESVVVRAGTLRFDLQQSATVYAGAAVGLIPSVLVPRYDLSGVVANFVTTPEGAQRIAGLVFNLRLSALGRATYRSADTTTDAAGFSFGLDICQSPIYDTTGFVLLLCGEYGGGWMALSTKGLDGIETQSKRVGFGTATLGGELQYNLSSIFQVGIKVGGVLGIGQITAERVDGSRIFASSPWSAYVLLGVGVHF